MKPILFTLFLLITVNINGIAQDSTSTFTDNRDGKVYKTVKIGSQWWMAENLQYRPANGSLCYDNNDTSCTRTGRYYTWEAALKACPQGWHLPSDAEWKTFEKQLGMKDADLDKTLKRYSGWVGKKIMLGGVSGFNAIFTGYVYSNGKGNFGSSKVNFWSSDEYNSTQAWYRSTEKDIVELTRFFGMKEFGYSVRCLKN